MTGIILGEHGWGTSAEYWWSTTQSVFLASLTCRVLPLFSPAALQTLPTTSLKVFDRRHEKHWETLRRVFHPSTETLTHTSLGMKVINSKNFVIVLLYEQWFPTKTKIFPYTYQIFPYTYQPPLLGKTTNVLKTTWWGSEWGRKWILFP